MITTRRRAALRAATALVTAGALIGSLAACAGGGDSPAPAASIPAEGVDDGSSSLMKLKLGVVFVRGTSLSKTTTPSFSGDKKPFVRETATEVGLPASETRS